MTIEEILAGESKNIEYKETIPEDSKKYVKTAVAFANGDGGVIVFGVQDGSKEVIGFPDDTLEDLYRKCDAVTSAIYDSCEPKILPDVGVQPVDDKYLIIATITPGMDRPYHIRQLGEMQGTYIRVAGTTQIAPREQLQEMILDATNRSFDQLPSKQEVSEKQVQSFCAMLYRIARKNCSEEEKGSVKKVTKGQLLSWRLISEENGKIVPSNGYLLLKGSQKDFPDARIQCAVCKGKTRGIYITRNEFSGALYEQIDKAVSFVLENIHLGMRIEGIWRREFYELPVTAIRELIANAVCHRSYLTDGKIQVILYDDRLEVTSPGMLSRDVTIERLKAGYSKPRNKGIAAAFSYMNIVEGWGGGIPKVISEAKGYGLDEPEFVAYESDFRVNLFRRPFETEEAGVVSPADDEETVRKDGGTVTKTVSKDDETVTKTVSKNDETVTKTSPKTDPKTSLKTDPKTDPKTSLKTDLNRNQSEKLVLTQMKKNTAITIDELVEKTGLSRSGVKYVIRKLKENGKIERQGSTRSGTWIIK